MKRISLVLTLLVLIISCTKEETTPLPPTKYTVSISLNPTDGGTVSPSGGQFDEGSTISFTVTPSDNYIFKNWSGSDTSSNNPLSLTINSNKTLTVNFEKISIDTDGDGVSDDIDLDNSTREGVPVDEDGVMLNPIYLDENGVTIKSQEWGIVGDVGTIDGVEYTIVDNELFDNLNVNDTDFTRIVTTLITNMSHKFSNVEDFNQDISSWDVSNVVNMERMFKFSGFNQDISYWDVSNVTNMLELFSYTPFNGNIGNWNVSNVSDTTGMFKQTPFNQDLSSWDVSSVSEMSQMFSGSQFNQDIGNWDVSNVVYLDGMFQGTPFNHDISSWDVSNVELMIGMFVMSDFNQNISSWDVSNVSNMTGMFYKSKFNQDIGSWDVSSVTGMNLMFKDTSFNQDLSDWNVSNVINCEEFSDGNNEWTLPKPNFTNCNPN